jgi:cyclase
VKLDRVAEDIFILVSESYAQVTATVLLTREGAIVVDTMPFPSDTRQIVSFIEGKLGPHSVRYVILTHHHADHVYGAYLFDGEVIAQAECRRLLELYGAASLARAKQNTPALADVELRLPNITLQEEMHLHVGHRHLRLFHTPGHSEDGISVFVADEKVLIAGDMVMPVPHIVGGNAAQLSASLAQAMELKPAFIVQGHGDVLLRGEIDEALQTSIDYLEKIAAKVSALVRRGDPPSKLRDISIESCGKSRIPLDGLVNKLHLDNLQMLYQAMTRPENERRHTI